MKKIVSFITFLICFFPLIWTEKTNKSDKEMDKIMFSKHEKNSMIQNYNLSVDSMYTNKGIGMKFFKDKILRQGSEMEWKGCNKVHFYYHNQESLVNLNLLLSSPPIFQIIYPLKLFPLNLLCLKFYFLYF